MNEKSWAKIALELGWKYRKDDPPGYQCDSADPDNSNRGWWCPPGEDRWLCSLCQWEELPQWDKDANEAIQMVQVLAKKHRMIFEGFYDHLTGLWSLGLFSQTNTETFLGVGQSFCGCVVDAVEKMLEVRGDRKLYTGPWFISNKPGAKK